MEFTLHYRGHLKAASGRNRRRDHKHDLRKHFHEQLKELWNQIPLSYHRHLLDPNPTTTEEHLSDLSGESFTVVRDVGKFQFAPVVSSELNMVADLTITLLRPGPPGDIVNQSGDLDNRLKTLLDALKIPAQPDELPQDASPAEDESPFFCLLEDDNLVTGLDIKSDRLLGPSADSSEVLLLIHVRTRLLVGLIENLSLL